jgi:patatin-like phospholipase/acyl hydrolase
VKRIAIMPGGGVRGVMSLACWERVERYTEERLGLYLHEFDLIVGTSVGGIAAGCIGSGKVDAREMLDIMDDVIPKAFRRRFLRVYPRYRRTAISRAVLDVLGPGFKMRDLVARVIITAVRARDKTNHYLKSWQTADGHLDVLECINRTYAAPMYFGKWRTPGTREVWLDGGTGSQNTPIMTGIWEAMRQGWLGNERVHMLSVGTGYSPEVTGWDKLRRMRLFREVAMYLDPSDGGLARYQSRNDNIKAAEDLAEKVPGFTFQHVDHRLTRKEDRLDGVRYMSRYHSYGLKMAEQVNYEDLEK